MLTAPPRQQADLQLCDRFRSLCKLGETVTPATPEGPGWTISPDDPIVQVRGNGVPIQRAVFVALFENSVVSSYADVQHALEGTPLSLRTFLKLARQAEIPYPLFFAPLDVVLEQVRLKTRKLMSGFTKDSFSMHSRNRVELSDVELIVKDLLRKQEILRRQDATLKRNSIVAMLKGSRRTVEEDVEALTAALGFTSDDLRAQRTKEKAFELVVERLEARQILVSRSAQHFMPQEMPPRAKFSGLTIKDKKVPFVFLATGDEGEHLEPAGRRIFTLVLLAVLIARDTFAPVNYDGHTKDATSPREYLLTAELLMPLKAMKRDLFSDLAAIREAADIFRVTPSAVAMRGWRLGHLERDRFSEYMDALRAEYVARPKQRLSSPLPVNAIKKYNGLECSRRMLTLLDSGRLSPADFRRVVLLNKLPSTQIPEFRRAVG